MVKKEFSKKSHFIFNRAFFSNEKKAYFVLNKSFSNFFITLMDLNKKIIVTKSTGMAKIGNSKKKKLSSQTISILVKQLLSYLNLYKITKVSIIFKIPVNKLVWTFLYKLKFYNIIIDSFIRNRRVPHNGMRSRKIRRV